MVKIEMKRVAYDIKAYQQSFIDTKMIELSRYWSMATMATVQSGENYQIFLLEHLKNVQNKLMRKLKVLSPDEIWIKAGESFPWPRFLVEF